MYNAADVLIEETTATSEKLKNHKRKAAKKDVLSNE
jgi:hypothetical protein